MSKPLYTIRTTMDTEDYHHFLYVSILRRNKKFVPTLVGVSAILALLFSFSSAGPNWIRFGIIWAVMLIVVFGLIIFLVERRYKKRIKTDQSGSFGAWGDIEFYSDYLVVKNEAMKAQSRFDYTKLFEVLLSDAFVILYFDAGTATLIRKRDIPQEWRPEFIDFLKKTFGKKFRKI
jgi:hypothetical protein